MIFSFDCFIVYQKFRKRNLVAVYQNSRTLLSLSNYDIIKLYYADYPCASTTFLNLQFPMTIRLGSDLIHLPKFEKHLRAHKAYYRDHIFCPEELEYAKAQRLACIFAVKEAVIKALHLGPAQWQEICIAYEESGKPYLKRFPKPKKEAKKWKHEISISHEGQYALANVIFYQ